MTRPILTVSPTCCLVLIAAVLWSTGLIASTASAQAPPAKERHTIAVRAQGNTCVYQIMDQANQDLFVVRPNGAVILRAQSGLWVDIAVEDAEVQGSSGARNVPGTRNRRSFALRPQAPQDAFTARSVLEGASSTEHRVRIQCCPTRERGQGCPAWQDAQPHNPASGESGGSASLLDSGAGMMMRGPAAPPAVHSPLPLPPGGPVMRVEEEQ
jgi:hypothetical protein